MSISHHEIKFPAALHDGLGPLLSAAKLYFQAYLTMFSDTTHYTQMINAEIKGFILKKSNKYELQQAINTVYAGGNYFSIQVHLILIDYSFGKIKCNETMMKAVSLWPDVKFLLLATYKEECNLNSMKTIDVMLKNSSKKEFENKIRQQQSAS